MEIFFLKASTRTLKPETENETDCQGKTNKSEQTKKPALMAVFISRMWLFDLSPICRLAGYATQKASWIPNSERERLIPILPQALYPPSFFSSFTCLLPSSLPHQKPTGPRTWPLQPHHLRVQPISIAVPLTFWQFLAFWDSSQNLSSGPRPPHRHYSSPAGWGPGHMATGGHVPEKDVLVNLQQVRCGLFIQ